jgi:hypothetical protein
MCTDISLIYNIPKIEDKHVQFFCKCTDTRALVPVLYSTLLYALYPFQRTKPKMNIYQY